MNKVSHSFIYKWSKTRLFSQHMVYCFISQFYCHLHLHCFIQNTAFPLALHENETNRDVSALEPLCQDQLRDNTNQHCLLVPHTAPFSNRPNYEILLEFLHVYTTLNSKEGCLSKGGKRELNSGSDPAFRNPQYLRSKPSMAKCTEVTLHHFPCFELNI